MAIALEADFRSPNLSSVTDSPDRKQSKAGSGDAFASSLARARDAEAADSPISPADASAATMALAFPSDISSSGISEPAIFPETEAANAAEALPPGSDAAEAILKSEIFVDRQIVREDAETQAEAAPVLEAGKDASPLPGVHAAAATEGMVPEASGSALTADNAPVAATENVSKISPHVTAQPAQVADAGRASAPAPAASPAEVLAASPTIAVVPGTLPATASTNAKAPAVRPTQQTEAASQPNSLAALPWTDGQLAPSNAPFAETEVAPFTDITAKGNPLDTANLNSPTAGGTQSLAAIAAPVTPQTSAAAPSSQPSAPAIVVVTASPTQIVDIVAETADDGQSDRIVVQLDPPELGRVSIDFKFDTLGLQHVTITSETPEAMRQLRQMHSELVQSLERHGISSENLSFEHQQQQQGSPQSPLPNPFARTAALSDLAISSSAIPTSTESIINARTLPGGRLDIRL